MKRSDRQATVLIVSFFGSIVVILALLTVFVIIPRITADDRCDKAGGVSVRSWDGPVCVPRSSLIHP